MLRLDFLPYARALLVCLLLTPALASAQDELTEVARTHFEAGTRAFEVGDLETAVTEFRAAYAITPHGDIQFNIYSALERLGRFDEAAEALERYLAEASLPDEERANINARLARLRERVATETPLEPPIPEPEETAEPAAPLEPQVIGPGIPGLVLIGIGGALVINFAIFAGLSEAEDSSLTTRCGVSCTTSDVSTLEVYNIVADVSWIAGGAIAVTGVILTFAFPERATPAIAIAPFGTRDAAGLVARGSF